MPRIAEHKKRPPSELHWFPFYVRDFTASPSVQRMSDAEVGRYLRLLLLAFGNGLSEPSLEPDDLNTASPRVKAQFFERDGRFYNETLSRVWGESQARHAQAVKRGKASGAARRKGKSGKQFRTAKSNGNEQAPVVVGVENQKDSLPRGAGAPALSGAAPALPAEENSAVRDVRQPGGLKSLADFGAAKIFEMAGLKPRAAT